MRNALLAAVLLCISSLLSFAAEPFTARVVQVIDGDTITVESPGHVFRVRLFGIDCPEKNQPGGSHATWFTGQMAMGELVQVVDHGTDRYGRLVAEIELPDGRALSKDLVRSGNAWWYAKYDPADIELADLEAAAHANRIGLWEAENPVPPWEWRKVSHPAASRSHRAVPR